MRDYEYSDLYFDAHLDKQIKIEVVGTGITIDNSMIELDAFELDEILCSEQELTFGSCEANCVEFTARDMPGSIVGKTIRITETVDGNTDAPFPYGVYKVYSDVPTSDRTKREITAYDAMYDIINADMKPWYAGLSFPMTLRQFRDSFFSHFGIAQKETVLVNDAMTVNKTLVAEPTVPESTITEESAISGKTVIEAICEINGVFGNINRDGQFEYVELKEIVHPLYPANDLYPSDNLFPRDPNTISMTGHYITFDYEDFQTKQITQLEIRPADDSAGAVVGISGNNYVISGNFLVSDKTGTELEAIASNTLSVIRKASYTPLKSSEIVGNPCIELGDPIRFNTTREIVESYVLQRTLAGIQNKRDSIVSSGTEMYNQNPNGIKGQIANMRRRTNKLERTADHTLSELSDLDKNTSSRFEQTAEQIQMEVTRATGAESALSSGITQNAESISAEVTNRQNADNEMSSKITQTAEQIQSEVTRAQGAEASLSSSIKQTESEIQSEVLSRESADSEIRASLTLKIDRADDGTIISLINGSADKIRFNANNMFTVASPNFIIDENGNVEIGGNFVADTKLSLCYNYASLPGIAYASKIDVINVGGGEFSVYYEEISGKYIFVETNTAYGMNLPILNLGADDKIQVIKTDKQFQASSIYAGVGFFDDLALYYTTGKYGGRIYKCFGDYGLEGIASPGYVQNWVTSQGYAKTSDIPSVPSSTYLDNRYMHDKVSGGSDGTGSVFVHAIYYSSGTLTVTTASVSSSDERLKTNISDMPDMESVYLKFKPKKFRFDDRLKGYDHRWHYGLFAQTVEKDLADSGIFLDDTGLIWKEPVYDDFHEREVIGDESVYKLDKDELHAMHIQMIQKLWNRCNDQQDKINDLIFKNLELSGELSILKREMEEIANVINNQNN